MYVAEDVFNMESKFISKWEQNKEKLQEYITNTPQKQYDEYKSLVELIVKYILNDNIDLPYNGYNLDAIHEIDDGDYQGTLLYFIPKNTYQPDVSDYIFTSVSYGSCSGCDTLQSIHNYDDEIPTKEQVEEYMSLFLHLVQNMKSLKTIE